MSTESEPQSPQNPDGPILRDHVYDGIQEFDQKLPNWWLFTLWIAVVFFIVYWMAFYQFGIAKTDAERLDPKIAELREKRDQAILAMLDDNNLWKMSRDASFVSEGEQIYNRLCVACHGAGMGGRQEAPTLIGRSLIDDEWAYGGTPTAIYKLVNAGTPNPAEAVANGQMVMSPMGTTLTPAEMAKVTAFVLSKHAIPEGVDLGG